MAKKPSAAGRTRLANALAEVTRLKSENDLRAEMLATSNSIGQLQAERLKRAAGLLRNAADQFDVRGAGNTATHLRAEADKLVAGIERDAQIGRHVDGVSPAVREALDHMAREPYQNYRAAR